MFIALMLSVFSAQATTNTFLASGTWIAPAGVTSATVEAWGGGGAGGGATGNPAKGGGGAGGQYATAVITVTPGNSYTVVVGGGGIGSTGDGAAGGDSTFNGASVVAKGGAGGASSGTAGTGSTTGGIGTTVYAGGSGSAGSAGAACNNGGAGGGGAGSGGAGGNAAAGSNTAGTGRATGGGAGGAGITSSNNGNAGNVAGGGGGGACAESATDRSGGAGGAGQVSITFTIPPPTVTGITPANGPTAGGTSVTITGTNFITGATVTIGGTAATGITVVNATTITATTPNHAAGIVNVVVTTTGGAGTGTNLFTYVVAPTVTSISPASGPLAGGTAVTITGTNFTGATAVTFDGAAATSVVVVSATSITAVTPAGTAGTASVLVTAPGGTNAANTLFTYVGPPTVISINTASVNPTGSANPVAWTVVFSTSVTGVDATDFVLVQAGGVTGATITSVTGSGTTWTVNANTGSGSGTLGLNLIDDDTIVDSFGQALGGAGAGNGNKTGQTYTISTCTPPSNIPAGVTVTCVCDNFGRASLNPSTIFGGAYATSDGTSDLTGVFPYINPGTGFLRLTENTSNNAKAATLPSIFPAAGNYISVEFNHYAYKSTASGGIGATPTGADGVAVTLSDYSIPAAPGGFGGSLGYAQSTGSTPNPPGFAGGWVGVGLDEYGNYQNTNEGRVLGPNTNIFQSVGVRGPGSGMNGYRWMGGTGSNPGGLGISNYASATPAPGYMYQVIVDARNSGTGIINVSVNRDATTKNGNTYTSLFGPFNAYTEANYALGQNWILQIVPNFWKISFTGSTGGSNNIHEIGGLRICAQSIIPATGGSASGYSAIDSAYPGAPPAYQYFQTGHIYAKLQGTAFNLYVAALTSTAISTGYSVGSSKYVQVRLVDNSDNGCGSNAARTCNIASCTAKTAVEANATQTATFVSGSATGVASPSPAFTLNSSYKNLVAVIKECTDSTCTTFTATTPACSADSFSVRPTSIATVTTSNATNTTTAGSPTFKAGSGNFNLTATTTGVAGFPSKYTGVLKINNSLVSPAAPATVAGVVSGTFAAATSATPSSTAIGNVFTYNEVGDFSLLANGVYDGVSMPVECTTPGLTTAQCDTLKTATWTGVDSVSTQGDCVADSFSNVKDASGKYGCNFGYTVATSVLGRFTPDHFAVSGGALINRSDICPLGTGCPSTFTYMGEQMNAVFTLTAQAAGGSTTRNYVGANGAGQLAKLNPAVGPLGLAVAYAAVSPAVAAGATTLSVNSTVGFVVGDALWIPGAGAGGATLNATVASLTSNTITLSTPIVTSVPPGGVTTTGAITTGTSSLVVVSTTGISIGDTLTISGAGLAGANLTVNITSIVGTTITVTPPALTTVAGATVAKVVSAVAYIERDLTARLSLPSAAAGSFTAGVANITAPLMVTRGATTNYYPALNVGIAPLDADQVRMGIYDSDAAYAAGNDHALIGSTDVRYGRMKLANALGSELLQLPIPVTAQYWNGSSYVTNSADNATVLNTTTVASPLGWTNLTPANCLKLSATSAWSTTCSSTTPATTSVVFVNGASSFKLTAPGNNKIGSVDMTTNAPTYLLTDKAARATFGVYKGANEFIYLRENY